MNPTLHETTIAATAFKLLLFPAYKSTDFEVHRNWLAITYSQPVRRWYYETTSRWTLDYPPFFAGFEWLLSLLAQFFDPDMLIVNNLGYSSNSTVLFQRLSVIFTELIFVYALYKLVGCVSDTSKQSAHAIALSLLLSPGLLIIDHIHFQYNGFMNGLLLLSILLARLPTTFLGSAMLFAAVLCLKHIYLYLAPAYFVYLLRNYCLGPNINLRYLFSHIRSRNCIRLGATIIGIFGASFGPFAYWGQLPHLATRLFPFSRGLCHAYWAPNVWALYSFVDRALVYFAPQLGLHVQAGAIKNVTRGLIGDTAFAVLPQITPRLTFLLTVIFQILPLMKLFTQSTFDNFIGAVTLCAFASFLFGWHVHEKAILLVIVPFSLLALKDHRYFTTFRPLAVAGHLSLFPLLFTAPELPIKFVYTATWLVIFLHAFEKLVIASPTGSCCLFDRLMTLFILFAIPVAIYTSLVHGLFFGDKYEFLPLVVTSCYSAVGIMVSWIGLLRLYFA
ncbi:glycosyltransferase family 57 protein [Wilcoxina mikolae CBS 423.85]|nr:glycosyltransferase family 57 protein [Wilcoxina mikolae CBS 423.85]